MKQRLADYIADFLINLKRILRNIQTRLLFSGNLVKHPCFDAIRETDKYRVSGELRNTDYIMSNSFWVVFILV